MLPPCLCPDPYSTPFGPSYPFAFAGPQRRMSFGVQFVAWSEGQSPAEATWGNRATNPVPTPYATPWVPMLQTAPVGNARLTNGRARPNLMPGFAPPTIQGYRKVFTGRGFSF